jgi:LytS/YehU family sensor histidine kinase
MRSTLEHSRTVDINLEDELARLRLYLEMQALRFGPKLRYSLQCDIDSPGDIEIPNMVVQPFIENAILHGIMPQKEGGVVYVYLHMRDDGVIVTDIYDTGIGITRARSLRRPAHKTSSLGMKLISDRFQLLQEMTGQKYAIIVREITLPSGEVGGTHVQLVFPARIREL